MNRFDYIFPVRIHFGQGCFEESLKQELLEINSIIIRYRNIFNSTIHGAVYINCQSKIS